MRYHAPLAVLLFATTVTAGAQVLNLRPGGWDLTVKDKSGGETNQVTTKICLTKEDLDIGAVFRKNEDAEGCKTTLGVRSPARVTGTIVCTGSDASRSTYEIVAHTPETMTMKTRTEGEGAGTVEVTGRFASPSCKGYDQ